MLIAIPRSWRRKTLNIQVYWQKRREAQEKIGTDTKINEATSRVSGILQAISVSVPFFLQAQMRIPWFKNGGAQL